ncbi:MAG: RnfABCDGE type electron transport complex subunit D, partial [Treponema sp.]|nr:RnfABCDGE type electron transport complex subunit D [Treponema sp.]
FSGDMMGLLVPFFFALSYGLLVRFVPISYVAGMQLYGDIFLAFLTSGVLFSTLFILQWFGTVPFSVWGRILYGLCAGFFSYLILGYGTSSVGYAFVVLVMNFISIIIQGFEMRKMRSFYKKSIKPRLEALKEVQSV